MRNSQTLWCRMLLVGSLLIGAGGCKVNSDDVAFWKGSAKGPVKLEALVQSDRYDNALKSDALITMVHMDRPDVNGLNLLQEALAYLQREQPNDVTSIVDATVPRLKSMMTAVDPETEDPNAASASQIRAKDAAHLSVPYASKEGQQELTASVVAWYAKDFPGRSLAGDYSAEQVIKALGAPAAAMLVDALKAHMPEQALVKISEIIAQQGEKSAKEAAGKRLVAIEKEMESPAYVKWLEGEISKQYEGQKEKPDAARLTAIAIYNREKRINGGVLPAMKHLGSVEVVRDRLLQIATTAPGAQDTDGWKERLNDRRMGALQALEGNASRKQLMPLLKVALDASNPMSIRDYAFDRIGDIRSPDAIPSLWPLVQSSGADQLQKRLRWRAGELVLAVGGNGVLSEFLGKLPSGVGYEPEELTGYATRISQMTPAPTSKMRSELSSSKWHRRVIAIKYLERRGEEADIARLKALSKNGTKLSGDGWSLRVPPQDTIGKLATAAAEELSKRLGKTAKP